MRQPNVEVPSAPKSKNESHKDEFASSGTSPTMSVGEYYTVSGVVRSKQLHQSWAGAQ